MFYKRRLLAPGPTPVLEDALLASARPMIHHRTDEFNAVLKQVFEQLKTVFLTKSPVLLFTSSGTGAMEAAVANLCRTDRPALVIRGGKFGERWGEITKAYGVPTDVIDVPWGEAVDPALVEKHLKAKPQTSAVFTTLSETSTCVAHPIRDLGAITRATDTVLVVDGISGLGGQECRTDEWQVDVVIAGSQKALMIPPGLAMASVSDRAWAKVKESNLPKYYFSFDKHHKNIAKDTTPYTPAVSLIFALKAALDRMVAEGMDAIFERHQRLGRAMREGVGAMGLTLFAKRPVDVATAVNVPAGVDGGKLKKMFETDFGITVAGGQDAIKGKVVRIAHMGYMDPFDGLAALGALGMGLGRLGHRVDIGAGMGAAMKVIEEKP
ncbi:MAG: hypothetical protein A3G34_09815 [Candidatus Lindowbacteria bacterium RIFCSPLOWO2_12_FULL_62_27]|nr:MAG: hypothetical protein A3G34_09815 [Candidatus Lindowbacteria bacterium RIFCSPLOWO2_12_FULL_62_27]OGH61540.1 MAG: hypothetical protein A3I06_02815 [Candidatus Lindowbacteria bacterium RIFCSPLOWO2_02_FULL_62_12]